MEKIYTHLLMLKAMTQDSLETKFADERGEGGPVGWILMVVAAIALVAMVVAFVTGYIQNQGAKLGG